MARVRYINVDSTAGGDGSTNRTTYHTLDAAAAVDATGGLVDIPITSHGFSVGESIAISGTTNYNSTYTVETGTSANYVRITATYVAETFAGTEIGADPNRAYANMTEWESNENINLTTSGGGGDYPGTHTVYCSGAVDSVGTVVVSGWTTSSTYDLTIQNHPDQPPTPYWDRTRYTLLEQSAGAGNLTLDNTSGTDHINVIGIQFENQATGSAQSSEGLVTNANNGGKVLIKDCLFWQNGGNTNTGSFAVNLACEAAHHVINVGVFGSWGGHGIRINYGNYANVSEVLNCTVLNTARYGIYTDGGQRTTNWYNNLSDGNTTGDYSTSSPNNSGGNYSGDATSPQTANRNATILEDMVSPDYGDFRLLKDSTYESTNLSSGSPPTENFITDINNYLRQDWDAGIAEHNTREIVPKLLTSGADDTGNPNIVTSSISWSGNKLLIAFVEVIDTTTVVPTLTTTGVSWVLIGDVVYSSGDHRLCAYRAMPTSSGSGTTTIDCNPDPDGYVWHFYEIGNVNTSGANGEGAIGQIVTDSNTSADFITLTMGEYKSSFNGFIGCWAVEEYNTGVDFQYPGSGLAKLEEIGRGSFAAALSTAYSPYNLFSPSTSFGGPSPPYICAAIGIEIISAERGLSLFYRGENSTQLSAPDDFSNGANLAILRQTATFSGSTVKVGSYSFHGLNQQDLISLDSSRLWDTGTEAQNAVGAWFYIATFSAQYNEFIRLHNTSVPNDHVLIRLNGTQGQANIFMEFERNGQVATTFVSTGNRIDMNTWYGIVFRTDRKQRKARIEIYDSNRTLIDSITYQGIASNAFSLSSSVFNEIWWGAAEGEIYMDNIFIANSYDAPIHKNLDITSYTQYDPTPDYPVAKNDPKVVATQDGRDVTHTNTHTVTIPSGAGNVLVIAICSDRSRPVNDFRWPIGWEVLEEAEGSLTSDEGQVVMAYKYDEGETSINVVSTYSCEAAFRAWRLDNVDLSITPQAVSQYTGSPSTTINVPQLSLSGGRKDSVCLVAASFDWVSSAKNYPSEFDNANTLSTSIYVPAGMYPIQVPCTQKPNSGAKASTRHKLDFLVGCMDMTELEYDLVHGHRGTFYFTKKEAAEQPYGPCLAYYNTATEGVYFPEYRISNLSDFTVTAVLRWDGATPDYNRIVSAKSDYLDQTGFEIALLQGDPNELTASGEYDPYDGFNMPQNWQNTGWHTVSVRYFNGNGYFYGDGKYLGTGTTINQPTSMIYGMCIGNNTARNEARWTGPIAMVAVQTGVGEAEILSVHDNPWQLFTKTVYVPSPAGAGFTSVGGAWCDKTVPNALHINPGNFTIDASDTGAAITAAFFGGNPKKVGIS